MDTEELIAKYQNAHVPAAESLFAWLDTIDWSSLHHAYGEASDFPPLLRALFSSEDYDRDFARHQLF